MPLVLTYLEVVKPQFLFLLQWPTHPCEKHEKMLRDKECGITMLLDLESFVETTQQRLEETWEGTCSWTHPVCPYKNKRKKNRRATPENNLFSQQQKLLARWWLRVMSLHWHIYLHLRQVAEPCKLPRWKHLCAEWYQLYQLLSPLLHHSRLVTMFRFFH